MEGALSFERNMNNSKNVARMERMQERMQQRREAGSVATHFPEVANIVMNMTYNQRGAKSILRTFNFTPNNYAFFMINCLRKDCVDGGFDLTHVITAMIRNRRVEAKDPSFVKVMILLSTTQILSMKLPYSTRKNAVL